MSKKATATIPNKLSKKKVFDYLIVGQGLAGTCLAHTLESKFNKSVFVVDRDSGKLCSSVAIGTFNPLAFRTFTPTWKALEIIPFLKEFYIELGQRLKVKLITDRPVFKIFKSEDQKRLWIEKSHLPPSSHFMQEKIKDEIIEVNASFGLGEVRQSGNVNMSAMLSGYRNLLKESESLLEEELDFEQLTISEDECSYKSITSKNIVFCQGHENKANPFFSELPFKLTKGEVIIVKIKDWDPKGIVHNNINIVPMGGEYYWIGSSFEWEDLSYTTTEEAKERLVTQLKETLDIDFEIVEQRFGLRPTVKDRRPLLGKHPDYNNLFIFNGLGTRGVMLAPLYASQMANYLVEGDEIEDEVNIQRFIE